MLFNARTALRALLALAATTAVVGNSFYDDESLAAREFDDEYSLSARGYYDEFNARSIEHSFHARGVADGGNFVLSARDLGKLGVRADDVSHVLVLRMSHALTPQERAAHTAKITWWQGQITSITPKIATALAAKKAAAKAKPKNQANIDKTSNAYSDLVQMKEGYHQEIEDLRRILAA